MEKKRTWYFYRLFKLLKSSYVQMNDKNEAFLNKEASLAFKRLRIISWCVIAVFPLFTIIDIQLYKEIGSSDSLWRLALIHLSSFLLACLFLLIHTYKLSLKRKYKLFILYMYVTFYLSIGVIGSINSSGLSENVDSYIVLMMGVATVFPLQPFTFGIIACLVHAGFIISMYQLNLSDTASLIKLVNTSAALSISILIVTLYYLYRRNHYYKEQELQQGEENFRTLFEVNPSPLLMLRADTSDVILKSNQALILSGDQGEESIHQLMQKTEMVQFLEEVKQQGSVKDFVMGDQTTNGLKRWLLINGELLDFNKQPSILLGFSDISHLKEKEEDLLFHASKDSLTSCYNRRTGLLYLQAMMQEELDPGLVICFLDINNLKAVNDQLGHAEGDRFIQSVCQIIETHMSPKDLFFRYGGDEFVLVLHNCDLESGQKKWGKIQEAFILVSQLLHKPYTMSVSCGFSFFRNGMSDTMDELIKEADEKMYINKSVTKQHPV
ncbi:sensor domain-containing diguanylate cyclase [Alkalicoccobacillus porphyridii]|uniref:Diguanylate cyclase n=1 Tax=Alkalicoccobacillus porphyridii TaxID=2597270 RepID=A0A553ZUY9_9BACI|nr:diguanylate cyclase [Alkalicoccobacillus porphyridii]TSB45126.1 diguanylate cyclase [Alkalicoccobacillus porphyridii]